MREYIYASKKPELLWRFGFFSFVHRDLLHDESIALIDSKSVIYDSAIGLPLNKKNCVVSQLKKYPELCEVIEKIIMHAMTNESENKYGLVQLIDTSLAEFQQMALSNPMYYWYQYRLLYLKDSLIPLLPEEITQMLSHLNHTNSEDKKEMHEIALLFEAGKCINKSYSKAIECWFSIWNYERYGKEKKFNKAMVDHVKNITVPFIQMHKAKKEIQFDGSITEFVEACYQSSMILSNDASNEAVCLFAIAEEYVNKFCQIEQWHESLLNLAKEVGIIDYWLQNAQSRSLHMLGLYHYNRGRLKKELPRKIEHYIHALEVIQILQDSNIDPQEVFGDISAIELEVSRLYSELGQYDQSYKYLSKAADKKNIDAQLELARLHLQAKAGIYGLQAIEQAIELFAKVALQGNKTAAIELADIVRMGPIVPSGGTFITKDLLQKAQNILQQVKCLYPENDHAIQEQIQKPLQTALKEEKNQEFLKGQYALKDFDFHAAYEIFVEIAKNRMGTLGAFAHMYLAMLNAQNLCDDASINNALYHIEMAREKTKSNISDKMNARIRIHTYDVAQTLAAQKNVQAACSAIHFLIDELDEKNDVTSKIILFNALSNLSTLLMEINNSDAYKAFIDSNVICQLNDFFSKTNDFPFLFDLVTFYLDFYQNPQDTQSEIHEHIFQNFCIFEDILTNPIGQINCAPLLAVKKVHQTKLIKKLERIVQNNPEQNYFCKRLLYVMKLWVHDESENVKNKYQEIIQKLEKIQDKDCNSKALLVKIYHDGIVHQATREICFKNHTLSLKLMQELADQGNTVGYLRLAREYSGVCEHTKIDPEKAELYFKKAVIVWLPVYYDLAKLYYSFPRLMNNNYQAIYDYLITHALSCGIENNKNSLELYAYNLVLQNKVNFPVIEALKKIELIFIDCFNNQTDNYFTYDALDDLQLGKKLSELCHRFNRKLAKENNQEIANLKNYCDYLSTFAYLLESLKGQDTKINTILEETFLKNIDICWQNRGLYILRLLIHNNNKEALNNLLQLLKYLYDKNQQGLKSPLMQYIVSTTSAAMKDDENMLRILSLGLTKYYSNQP